MSIASNNNLSSAQTYSKFQAWTLAARPKTLAAAVAPIIAASSLAYSSGYSVDLGISVLCFLCAALIQIATNYINDGADFESGADSKDRLGPKRAAMLGLLRPNQLYTGAVVCLATAFLIGLYLTYLGGVWIFALGVLSLLFAALYTKGPLPLAYNGLGDLFVFVFFGLVAVNGVFFLLTGTLTDSSYLLGALIGCAALLIMVSNNTRDIPTDTKVGKWTVSALIGEKCSKYYFAAIALTIPVLMSYLFFLQSGTGYFLIIAFALLSLFLVRDFFKAQSGQDYNALLERSAKFLLGLSLGISVALVAFRWGYVYF